MSWSGTNERETDVLTTRPPSQPRVIVQNNVAHFLSLIIARFYAVDDLKWTVNNVRWAVILFDLRVGSCPLYRSRFKRSCIFLSGPSRRREFDRGITIALIEEHVSVSGGYSVYLLPVVFTPERADCGPLHVKARITGAVSYTHLTLPTKRIV